MAQLEINSIKELQKERNTIHSKVEATYTIFEDNGNKYVQLDTYGKAGRALPGKISQSVQFDRESARYLSEIFAREFCWEIK